MEHVGAVGTGVAEAIARPHLVERRLRLYPVKLHLTEEVHGGNGVCVPFRIEGEFIGVGQAVELFEAAETDDWCSGEVAKEPKPIMFEGLQLLSFDLNEDVIT